MFIKKKMPTAFCSLEDAYGDWNRPMSQLGGGIPNVRQTQQPEKPEKPVQTEQEKPNNSTIDTKFENMNGDIRNFCPNCKSCIKANDELQQKIINQVIWPRPRWIPQTPDAYVPYDPYNRYWTNMYPMGTREDFGSSHPYSMYFQNDNVSFLLNVVIFILSVLLIIHIVEFFMKYKKED